MSNPINIPFSKNKEKRSLSEEFESKSEDSKKIILAMTNGTVPSSKTTFKFSPSTNRVRFDSADLSPVSKGILEYHGIKK